MKKVRRIITLEIKLEFNDDNRLDLQANAIAKMIDRILSMSYVVQVRLVGDQPE